MTYTMWINNLCEITDAKSRWTESTIQIALVCIGMLSTMEKMYVNKLLREG